MERNEGEKNTKDIEAVPELNHLVLCATHIEKTAGFYHSHLSIAMSEVEQLKHKTPVTQLAKYALESLPQSILGFFKPTISSHLKDISTKMCYLRTTGDAPLLVIMTEEDYETKKPIFVSGNTVYKTSWLLSQGVDAEVLAWDLSEKDVWFRWADIGSDGEMYTPEQPHSLFLRDPDGRFVELIPNSNEGEETPIVSKFTERVSSLLYPTIYTDNLEAWKEFMSSVFKIKEGSRSFYQYSSGKTSEIMSWRSGTEQWPLFAVICETNAEGKKMAYGGYGLEHIGYTGAKDDNKTAYSTTDPIVNHKPLRPDKSYEHYLCKGPDGVSIEFMAETP